MVRAGSFDSNGMKKGAWSEDEDNKLRAFILTYGHCNWRLLPKYAGLKRCGKSCRLRWMNHLKPGVKRGNFSKEEEDVIIKLHSQMGNKWSAIAAELPGRTDNDIKNFWHTHLKRRRSSSSSSSTDDQNKLEMNASSLVEIHESSNVTFDTNYLQFPQMDLWADADANCSQNEVANFPPILVEEDYFCFPQIYYNDWNIGDEDIHSHSIWDESFADYHHQPQTSIPVDEGINYDPIFAYGIHQSF